MRSKLKAQLALKELEAKGSGINKKLKALESVKSLDATKHRTEKTLGAELGLRKLQSEVEEVNDFLDEVEEEDFSSPKESIAKELFANDSSKKTIKEQLFGDQEEEPEIDIKISVKNGKLSIG